MDIYKIPYKTCRYTINSAKIIIEGWGEHELNPTENISYMTLEKDFENYMYPFLTMDVVINTSLYRQMRLNNDKVKMFLQVRSALFEKDAAFSHFENYEYENYINQEFKVFLEENSTFIEDPIHSTIEKNSGSEYKDEYKKTTFDSSAHVKLLLLNEQDISVPKLISAAVLKNVTVTETVTYLLTGLRNGGIDKKILMSPSQNNTIYPEMKLPPIRYDEAIERVTNNYALHENGSNLFFDFDRIYILDRINKCTAWEHDEYKVVNVVTYELTEGSNYRTGFYDDYENQEYYCTTKETRINTNSFKAIQQFGKNILVIDKKTGESSVVEIHDDEIKMLPADKLKKCDRTMVINSGNRSTVSALKMRLQETSAQWTIRLDNVNLKALTPNREFKFIFLSDSNKDYQGTFRLKNFKTSFNRSNINGDGSWYEIDTVAEFCGGLDAFTSGTNSVSVAPSAL